MQGQGRACRMQSASAICQTCSRSAHPSRCQASLDGRTALHYAAISPSHDGHAVVIGVLLKAGANIDAATSQPLNNSVLRSAGEGKARVGQDAGFHWAGD